MQVASISPDTGQYGGDMRECRRDVHARRGSRGGLLLILDSMKDCFHSPGRAALSFALAAAYSLPVWSQPTSTLQETVVTVTRVAQPLSDLVADVSIIDRVAIERSGAAALADVLALVPGMEMARNGGPGTTTNVFVRGAESQLTAVYIDGIRVGGQSASGGASWENIPLSQIDRIEVLRGPASAVYGSDAMGGVIQIFTRKGQDGFSPYASIGLATYGTAKTEAGFSGANGALDYAFGLADEVSNGFNVQPISSRNRDDDGYRSQSARGRLDLQLNKTHRLEASVLSSDLVSRYDSSTQGRDDLNLRQLVAAGLNWQAQWNAAYSTKFSLTNARDKYETRPGTYLTLTELRGYLLQNEYRQGAHLFSVALERREDQLGNADTTPRETTRYQNGVALGYGWNTGPHSLQLHARQDQDSEFGAQNTGSAAYGYAFLPLWRFTASTGTAFRAPTLYQRFSKYGLSTLQPQTSRNVEMGLRRTEGASSWGVVAYRNTVSNLIDNVSGSGPCANGSSCYANVSQAEYIGITLSGNQRLGNTNLHGSLDVQDPRDQGTGKLLRRRSNQHATLGVSTLAAGWSLGADAQLSGVRYSNATNTEYLAGYALVNLHAQTRVSKEWTVLLRVDNATDAQYQLVKDYATPGRTLYVGLKWAPQ